MTKYWYNADCTKYLTTKKVYTKEATVNSWEIFILKDFIATTCRDKNLKLDLQNKLKAFASTFSAFKDDSRATSINLNAHIGERFKIYPSVKSSLKPTLSQLYSIAPFDFYVDKYGEPYKKEGAKSANIYGNLGNANSFITIIVEDDASKITDSRACYKIDFAKIEKQKIFSTVGLDFIESFKLFLSQIKTKTHPVKCTCFDVIEDRVHYRRQTHISSKQLTVDIDISDVLSSVEKFYHSIDSLIKNHLPESLSADPSNYKELEWSGSFKNEDSFQLSRAFYLIGKKFDTSGFLGLELSAHSSRDLYRFGIVKDIANAYLFHKMPSKELLARFEPVSVVNVNIDFKDVENVSHHKEAQKIQSFIEKSKLENVIACLTTRDSEEDKKSFTKKSKL